MSSFTNKQLRVTLLGPPDPISISFGDSNELFSNRPTLIVTNTPISVEVKQVARLATEAHIKLYGLLQKDMDALTATWANGPLVVTDRIVTIEANDGSGWVTIFEGVIFEAQPQYNGAPNTYFQVQAMTGYLKAKVFLAESTTYPTSASIVQIANDLGARMGFKIIDGGAKGVLSNQYLWGSLWDQFTAACTATNTDFYIQNDTILITEAGKPRDQKPTVVLNAQSGLVGYPVFERAGLNVTALFNPAFTCGVPLKIESIVPSANGIWYPIRMTHNVEKKYPGGGTWFTRMQCLRVLI